MWRGLQPPGQQCDRGDRYQRGRDQIRMRPHPTGVRVGEFAEHVLSVSWSRPRPEWRLRNRGITFGPGTLESRKFHICEDSRKRWCLIGLDASSSAGCWWEFVTSAGISITVELTASAGDASCSTDHRRVAGLASVSGSSHLRICFESMAARSGHQFWLPTLRADRAHNHRLRIPRRSQTQFRRGARPLHVPPRSGSFPPGD